MSSNESCVSKDKREFWASNLHAYKETTQRAQVYDNHKTKGHRRRRKLTKKNQKNMLSISEIIAGMMSNIDITRLDGKIPEDKATTYLLSVIKYRKTWFIISGSFYRCSLMAASSSSCFVSSFLLSTPAVWM